MIIRQTYTSFCPGVLTVCKKHSESETLHTFSAKPDESDVVYSRRDGAVAAGGQRAGDQVPPQG